jgi:hypothetical protein
MSNDRRNFRSTGINTPFAGFGITRSLGYNGRSPSPPPPPPPLRARRARRARARPEAMANEIASANEIAMPETIAYSDEMVYADEIANANEMAMPDEMTQGIPARNMDYSWVTTRTQDRAILPGSEEFEYRQERERVREQIARERAQRYALVSNEVREYREQRDRIRDNADRERERRDRNIYMSIAERTRRDTRRDRARAFESERERERDEMERDGMTESSQSPQLRRRPLQRSMPALRPGSPEGGGSNKKKNRKNTIRRIKKNKNKTRRIKKSKKTHA